MRDELTKQPCNRFYTITLPDGYPCSCCAKLRDVLGDCIIPDECRLCLGPCRLPVVPHLLDRVESILKEYDVDYVLEEHIPTSVHFLIGRGV